jgi:Glycosyltransferase sugar-binding region containing DXD motif
LSRHPPPATVDAERVADDDRLRSNYVRELVWEASHDTPSPPANEIPTTIMQFWDNASAIPADVSECLDSWRSAAAAAGLTYTLFDDASAERCIASSLGSAFADAFTRCPHPAMRSDYFRLCYIFRYGGLYVDADDVYKGVELRSCFDDARLKVQPLCYDVLSDGMVPAEVFREPQESASSWIFYVNNNPLVAPPFHPIVRLALSRATALLVGDSNLRFDVQATTGPGNLTRCLVRHALTVETSQPGARDFLLMPDWDEIATSRWPLSYRDDERNWRRWNPQRSSLDHKPGHESA